MDILNVEIHSQQDDLLVLVEFAVLTDGFILPRYNSFLTTNIDSHSEALHHVKKILILL